MPMPVLLHRSARRARSALWVLSVLIALISLRFLAAGVEASMPGMVHHALDRPMALYGHIFFAPVALALLPLQFSARLRARRRGLHRWLGRVYAVSILIAGIAGLTLGFTTAEGPVAASGLMALAAVWLGTTALAVWHAVNRRIALHRAWMIRSAALTLAAVTLRIYLPIGGLTVGYEASYPVICWLCWVPNLTTAEWFLTREKAGRGGAAA
jgi:hypothetical protein